MAWEITLTGQTVTGLAAFSDHILDPAQQNGTDPAQQASQPQSVPICVVPPAGDVKELCGLALV